MDGGWRGDLWVVWESVSSPYSESRQMGDGIGWGGNDGGIGGMRESGVTG